MNPVKGFVKPHHVGVDDYNAFGNNAAAVQRPVVSRNDLKRPCTSLRDRPPEKALAQPEALKHSIMLRKRLLRQESQNINKKTADNASRNEEGYKSYVAADDSQFYQYLEEELGIKQLESESVLEFLSDGEDERPQTKVGGMIGENFQLEKRQKIDLKGLDLGAEEENVPEHEESSEEWRGKAFRIKTKVGKIGRSESKVDDSKSGKMLFV